MLNNDNVIVFCSYTRIPDYFIINNWYCYRSLHNFINLQSDKYDQNQKVGK